MCSSSALKAALSRTSHGDESPHSGALNSELEKHVEKATQTSNETKKHLIKHTKTYKNIDRHAKRLTTPEKAPATKVMLGGTC